MPVRREKMVTVGNADPRCNWLGASLFSVQREKSRRCVSYDIEEAAQFIFVSQAHICHLLNIGVLVEVEAESSSR